MSRRGCLSGDDACTGLVPCAACRRATTSTAVVPALLASGEVVRDQVRDLLAASWGVEPAEAFAASFPGPSGFTTQATVAAAFRALDEGWERCRKLAEQAGEFGGQSDAGPRVFEGTRGSEPTEEQEHHEEHKEADPSGLPIPTVDSTKEEPARPRRNRAPGGARVNGHRVERQEGSDMPSTEGQERADGEEEQA